MGDADVQDTEGRRQAAHTHKALLMRGCTAGRFKETKGLAGGQRNGNGRPRRGDNESRARQNENLLPGRSCKQLLSEASVLPPRSERGEVAGATQRELLSEVTRRRNTKITLVAATPPRRPCKQHGSISFFLLKKVSCLQEAAEILCGRKN